MLQCNPTDVGSWLSLTVAQQDIKMSPSCASVLPFQSTAYDFWFARFLQDF